MNSLAIVLQALVASSIFFFVRVVRHDNIVLDFEHHGLPNWLRDLVGIHSWARASSHCRRCPPARVDWVDSSAD